MGNKYLDGIALTIAIIGAVNWGLIGFLDFNLVASIFGSMTWISRIVYALVGICGLYLVCFYMKLGNVTTDTSCLLYTSEDADDRRIFYISVFSV